MFWLLAGPLNEHFVRDIGVAFATTALALGWAAFVPHERLRSKMRPQGEQVMRLEPVDRPPTLKARVAAWMMKRQLGKVITPARVVYNRVPRMYDVGYALVKLQQRGLALDPTTRLLVTSWVAMQNHCGFCVDIARAAALMEHVGLEKLNALPEWRSSPLFDERERAALAFAEEANRSLAVSDETFERARKHFSEREVTEIVILGAVENFYNRLNIPLQIEEDGLCAIQQRRRAHA